MVLPTLPSPARQGDGAEDEDRQAGRARDDERIDDHRDGREGGAAIIAGARVKDKGEHHQLDHLSVPKDLAHLSVGQSERVSHVDVGRVRKAE